MDGIVQSKGPSNSNASDRCATPDHYSNGRGSDTDIGVHGSSNSSARLVVGRSLAGWLQRRLPAGRRQWSAGWLDIATSWLLSPGANSDALVDRIYHLHRLPLRPISIIAQGMRGCLPISPNNASNRARGQCSVTTLVVHDILGGDILTTTWTSNTIEK